MMNANLRKILGAMAAITVLISLPVIAIHSAPPQAIAKKPVSGLTALQQEIIAKLSGAAEIRAGLKLANRTAIENRQEARTYLVELWKRLGLFPRRQAYGTEGENIFTILPCGKPGAESIVLGAHYDSARNSPGANDDASGVAAVAGIAQELSRVKKRSRDIIFVFFDEEERGLRGSRAFAQMLLDEKRAVHSVHTIDQMGWDQDADRAIELELPFDGAEELYKQAAESLNEKIPILTTTEAGSDHSSFRKLGMKAVGITEEYRNKDTTPFIHRPGDTYETMNFDYLASTTRLLVAVMKNLVR
jgi:acetylornithine deacetylase/succinyl-diaminopimelate desuccinylase-like protein